MTDRELLELAAKASGLYVKSAWVNPDDMFMGLIVKPSKESSRQTITEWNPLTDDGDALWLAVKLRISLHIRDQTYTQLEESAVWMPEGLDFPEDRCAATRRAIVRTAAEIGKGME